MDFKKKDIVYKKFTYTKKVSYKSIRQKKEDEYRRTYFSLDKQESQMDK